MSRPKAFNCDDTLDRAMRVFWEKGYEATSIQDLVDATHVNRASLYSTYGPKRKIFELALERFQNAETSCTEPGLRGIRATLEAAARTSQDDPRGCMLLNSVTELAGHDPHLCAIGKAARERMERFFADRLAEASEAGELGPGRYLPSLAVFLSNTFFGLRATAKLSPPPGQLESVVETTLALLSA